MSFAAEWLALREAADGAARDAALRRAAGAWLGHTPEAVVMDLGCGTGAMRRALAGVMPATAHWLLVDRDEGLLAIAAREGGQTIAADMAQMDGLPFEGVRLVTANALLDLASAAWVEALAARVAAAGAGVYVTLSYDGQMAWGPDLAEDAATAAAFNRHQRRNKGLGGPALGPDGAGALAAGLKARGYAVELAASPWRLEAPRDAALMDAFCGGVAGAAEEAGAASAAAWLQARRAAATSTSHCIVGHVDLLALPPSTQSNTTSDSRA